ncbi:MAG: cadherin-like domain-containing protein, partial [Candidatus Bipolaricaulota bacterium]|nr:cadherin-like domain-containing protein [Candidatus Bipolaricaulota bacterium]MDW8127522.1 cadherin-like domain-containing protein [Candidatus Bipolaricaulota bacterium]
MPNCTRGRSAWALPLLLLWGIPVFAGTTLIVVTDSSWTFNGNPVYVHPDRCHSDWMLPTGGARWIWRDGGMCSQPCRTDEYFTRSFYIPPGATIISARLEVAADNFAWVFITNSQYVSPQEIAYVAGFAAFATFTVTNYLRTETNTLHVRVENHFTPDHRCGGDSPTGFIARLTVVYNSHPTAQNDGYTTYKNTPLTVSAPGVLANDSDPDWDALTAELVSGPTQGTLTLNPNGSFTYTPPANWTGTTTFTYRAKDTSGAYSNTATVTITVQNRAPTAQNESYTTYKNTPLNVGGPGVLANDSDPDGDALTAELVSGPAQGTLTLNPNGSFTYTPPANWTGTTTFTYRAKDTSGAYSNTA